MKTSTKILLVIAVVLVLGAGTWLVLGFSGLGGTFVNFNLTSKEAGSCYLATGTVPLMTRGDCKKNQHWYKYVQPNGNELDARTGRCHEKGTPPDITIDATYEECQTKNWDTWFANGRPKLCRVDRGYESLGCH
ncbi:MAG: hypothetical protein U0517_03675 [Candidatus Andersenbacteria bacterium]